jgi:hypothetical protein
VQTDAEEEQISGEAYEFNFPSQGPGGASNEARRITTSTRSLAGADDYSYLESSSSNAGKSKAREALKTRLLKRR